MSSELLFLKQHIMTAVISNYFNKIKNNNFPKKKSYLWKFN